MSFVYYAKACGLDRVKIGHTNGDPMVRISSMQTGSPIELELLAFHDGTTADERAIHAKFSHWRLNGEWFTLSAEIQAHIDEIVAIAEPYSPGTEYGINARPTSVKLKQRHIDKIHATKPRSVTTSAFIRGMIENYDFDTHRIRPEWIAMMETQRLFEIERDGESLLSVDGSED